MKRNIMKMVVVLLSLVLAVGVLPKAALADEMDSRAVPMCPHNYVVAHSNAYYIQLSDEEHIYREVCVYSCVLCDHEYETIDDTVEDHDLLWIGHYGEYFRYQCEDCGDIILSLVPLH